MEYWEFVGYRLLNDTSITNEVGQRVFHGVRPPMDAELPCINFFQVIHSNQVFTDTRGSVLNPLFQISCRAETAAKAMEVGRLVGISFHNLSGTINSFDLDICKQIPTGGLMFEEDGERYHVPVEVRIVFQDNTIS